MIKIFYLVKSRASVLAYVAAFDATLLLTSHFNVLPTIFLYSTLAVYFISLANYTLSDIFDVKEDMINNPGRPLASGKVSIKTALIFTATLVALALLLGSLINLYFDSFLLASFILSFIYSGPKIRGKRNWLSKIIISALGGFIAPLAVVAITGFSLQAVLMSVILSAWVLFSIDLGDIADYEGDKKAGVMSFAVAYGKDKAITLLKVLLIIQYFAEVGLAFTINYFNFFYFGFITFLLIYFLKNFLEFKSTNNEKAIARKLKTMTRISVIALQLVTLSLLI